MTPDHGRIIRRTHHCMGTVASVHLHLRDDATIDDEAIDDALRACFDELDRLEQMFSTFRPDSEISRINAGQLHLLDASPEVIDVLDACTWLEHASEGAFSPRDPMRPDRIDPAGFVKGWATAGAGRRLTDHGLTDWILSVGGDIQTSGHPIAGTSWDIAVADPQVPGEALLVLQIESGAIATSGTAERGGHVWNAASETDPDRLLSLTVTGPDIAWVDAFATAGFALGIAGVAWVARFDGHHAIAVTADGRVITDTDTEIST